jgi:DNA primase large subunit
MKIDEEEWKQLIIERINILGINGEKDFQKDNFETIEEYKDRGQRDIKGHFILKLGVYMDPRLSAWFLENEGDLFQHRFSKSKWEVKKQILDFLFPDDTLDPTWFELEDLEEHLGVNVQEKFGLTEDNTIKMMSRMGRRYNQIKGFGMGKLIAIDFRFASFIIKTRRILLYQGWAIGSLEKLMSTIKHRYQDLLNDELIKLADRRQTEVSGPQKALSDNISELLQKLVKPKRSHNMGGVVIKGNFDDHVSYYPPCIKELMNQVETKGYIAHWERFQLGLFLKHTGMDVEEQLQYWYGKAVDNIGLSFADFKKRAGYIIRHIYGLEGGRIDYDMPSCNTIQTKMYCYFRHKDASLIAEDLSLLINQDDEEQTKLARQITDFTSRGFSQQACSKYMQLVAKDKLNTKIDKIYHPMIYLKVLAKSAKIYKEVDQEPAKATDEDNESLKN